MKHLSRVILILVFSLLAGCKTNKISVVKTNFESEISLQQNLSFKFNKDIATESMLNKWDTTSYIQFEPSVKGKFQWVSASELVFSPDNGFNPETQYKAIPTNAIGSVSAEKLSVSSEAIEFHTPFLEMSSAKAYWGLSSIGNNDIVIAIDLMFNYPVKASDLDKKLTISVGEYQVPYRIISTDENEQMSLEINPPSGLGDLEIPVKIVLDKEMKYVGGNVATQKNQEVNTIIPARSKLMVTAITSEMVDGSGFVNIFTTQPLLAEGLKANITFSPDVSFTLESQNNVIRISGDFEEGKTYKVTVSKNVQGIFGKSLENDYSQSVQFSKSKPFIAFSNPNDTYLSSKGERNVAINFGGMDKVKLNVFKIYDNNILHYLRGGKKYSYFYDDSDFEETWMDFYEWQGDDYYGRQVYEKQLDIDKLPKYHNSRLLNLDLKEINNNDPGKGIYIITVQDTKQRWLKDAIIVSISDIGLIAKIGKNSVLVSAFSIVDANPIAGVNIDFISTNNQKVHTATTGQDGFVQISNTKDLFKGFKIGMITARQGEDFNYLFFDNSSIETSRYEVGGKYTNASDFDVFIYGDRKLYRPGDSVYVNSITRTLNWETPKEIPLKFRIVNPNGRQLTSMRKTTNAEGACEIAFKLPDAAITGTYTVELYSGNDVLYNTYRFLCEEFMPDRLMVKVTLPKKEFIPGESFAVQISAENFFGTPATDRKVENELSLKRTVFNPKKFSDYDFNISISDNLSLENDVKSAKTDKSGKAIETFSIPNHHGIGMLNGTIYTSVFDENNRPVNRISTFRVPTQSVFFGLQYFDSYVNIRRPMKVNMISLNKDEQLVKSSANVIIIRKEYQSVIQRSGTNYNYNSNKREIEVYNKTVNFAEGRASVDFTPSESGEYELRIYAKKDEGYVSKKFWAYGSGETDFSSFEVDKDGEIIIETDKDNYLVGEKAEILFKCPFSGKLIVTIERDNITEYKVLPIVDKVAKLTLPLSEQNIPNIYVSATAIRPLSNNNIPLTVAHGYTALGVENPSYKMKVAIKAPTQVLSRSKQTVEVTAEAGSQVTIAVVDEGILQMNNYKTPDPYAYFYQKRALEIESYDLYARIFPELKRYLSTTGGDLALEMGKRVNPFTNKRVKLIALWSGILPVTGGNASYTFNIPQFSGSLRVMAVAWKGRHFGSAETNMKVADPIVISTALPRFLSPDDMINVPVTLSNTTKETASVTVKIDAKGPATIIGESQFTLSIPANSEKRVAFKAKASKSMGEALFTTSAIQGGKTFMEEIYVPVRPSAGFIKYFKSGVINNSEETIKLEGNFIAGSVTNKLLFSKSPITEFTKDISELINYPYGCLEQTVSTAFPLIYYRDIAKSIGQDNKNINWNPDYLVQEAIYKVQNLQQYSGGMLYWPNGGQTNWWATAYATHFLIEAKNAGFEVNVQVIKNAVNYLESEAKNKKLQNYYYTDQNGKSYQMSYVNQEVGYSLFVCALAGSKNISLLNYYKTQYQFMTEEGKYMLATAFALSGNKNTFRELLPNKYTSPNIRRESWGSFDSPIRNSAIVLYTLYRTDPSNPQIINMTSKLSNDLKHTKWLSTQDRAFALLALGNIAKSNINTDVKASISKNDQNVGQFNNENLVITKAMNNSSLKISKTGNGKLYYFYEADGFSKDGNIDETDNYLAVRRFFFDRFGKQLTSTTFKSNDLIVVRVSVVSLDQSRVENVAICDMLPACFEIENPRINNEREYSWIKDRSTPDYIDIRDDRITYFTTVNNKIKNFYYVVRVVSSGTFKIGVLSADAMYDGNYYSYNGSGTITVE